MLTIAEIGRSGERYILSSGFVELADIIDNLAKLTDTKPVTRRIPFRCSPGNCSGNVAANHTVP
jgi:hypothetical protein